MRFARTSKVVGVAAVAALALGACAGPDTGGEDTDSSDPAQATGGTVTVAETNSFTSFNQNSATGNVDINGKVSTATQSGFNYIDNSPEIVPNEDFGTYEVLSEDPLTIEYRVNEGVTWSDGDPIDGGDLLLAWAVFSGHFNDEDPEAETGTTYFDYAGDTSGVGLSGLPVMGEDGRSMTLEYSEPFADWESAYDIDLPAHVVATGGGLADEQALIDLIMSAPEGDPENPEERPELSAVGDFWNTAFDTTSLPTDPSLFLSSGPYVVQDMVAEQSMTLVKNESYTWGPEPMVDEITIRFIGAAPAQVQALQNGEVDVIAPQASADTLASTEGIEGITIEQANDLSFDHLDLHQGGVFEDENVRRAFLLTVPTQAILESTILPLVPDAVVRDSQIFDVGTPGYEAAITVNGSEEYNDVNIDMATELLEGATPEVRIMYNADNPNRVDAYTLIAESATQAGFTVVDGGLPATEWGAALSNSGEAHDASIFGWISSGVGVTGVPQLYGCGSASNFGQWCDEEAQAAMDELIVTTDEARQDELSTIVDRRLFETAFGLPLFQGPGFVAVADRVQGVEFNPTQTGVFWNVWEWSVTE
ncbi:ABC transporter family substrate-binding protein [Arthrobacter sp. H5]|uniref:ABC transporter family substrate-binding protein n=1 Tax=Arthrobacter sp. H5 TaxID=1267973 RepID=UPI0004872023|nr:ABC transporter family substrate-binding protein [Arthrobacter sp. H5]